MKKSKTIGVVMCSILGALSFGATDSPNPSSAPKLSGTVGVDYASQYYFRGIPQENQDWIVQPYASLGLTFPTALGPFENPTISIGTWNSFHGGPTGQGDDNEHWYESDIIGALSATIADKTTLTLGYTAYTSPNDSYNTYQEINFNVSYDDAIEGFNFAWKPHAQIAVEIDDQADAGNSKFVSTGTHKGIYGEIGIAPELKLIAEKEDSWRLAFPTNVGFSIANYYETSDGNDRTFGYADAGAELIIPLSFVKWGTWTVRGGPHVIWMGDNNTRNGASVTGGDQDIQFYGKIGLSVSF